MDLYIKKIDIPHYEMITLPQDEYAFYGCPICHREDSSFLVGAVTANNKTSIESAFCKRCEHRYHRKLPRPEWLKNYYQSIFQGKDTEKKRLDKKKSPTLWRWKRAFAQFLLGSIGMNIPHRVYDFLGGVLKKDRHYFLSRKNIKKILEIGCGYGDSLWIFRKLVGGEVYGVEANQTRLNYCKKLGFKVFSTEFNLDEARANGPFDFVYSKHVLEHIVDIDGHAKLLAELVSENGFLYIETPELSGEFLIHQTIQVEHVQTFSIKSLGLLLSKYGFSPIRILIDNNIQILAQKSTSISPFHRWLASTNKIKWEREIDYLEKIRENSPHQFSLQWDHYWIKLQSLLNEKILFDGNIGPFLVKRLPFVNQMIFETKNKSVNNFPFYLHYTDSFEPPILFKL